MHFTIVSYTFPPSKDIGGRRWGKFSKYIKALGHEVSVICSEEINSHNYYISEYPEVNIVALPKCYPNWLTGFTKSFYEKILYFVSTRLLSGITKRNLFDRGFVWDKPLLRSLEKLHTERPIDVLIATGAPFSLLLYGSIFKLRHNEIKYVIDMRDPWTWGAYYGFKNLSARKVKYQNESEHRSVQAANMICYPTNSIGNFLRNKYPDCAEKLYYLPHAYEPEKFPKMFGEQKREGFIYGGTIYDGIENYLKKFDSIVRNNPERNFKWDIYSGTSYPLLEGNFADGKVKKHPFVKEEELFRKICKASAYLMFFPETDKDIISTKFYEIIYTNTPILFIGPEGEVARFVREERLGVHILPENMELELPKYLNGEVPFEKGYFDVSQYSFSRVTEKFVNDLVNYRN